MYVIKVQRYAENPNNPEDIDYTVPAYVGTEGKLKIFVLEDEMTENTKRFKTAKEAGEYVDKHFGADAQRISWKTVSIEEIQ